VLSGLSYQSCLVYLDDVIGRGFRTTAESLQVFAFPEVCKISWLCYIRSRHCCARGQYRCHLVLAFVPKPNRSTSVHGTQRILQTLRQGYLHYRFAALWINEEECWIRMDQTMPRCVQWIEEKSDDGAYTCITEKRRIFLFGYRRFRLWPRCHTVLKADRNTYRSTCSEARPKASCFKDVIENRKQVRNDTEKTLCSLPSVQ